MRMTTFLVHPFILSGLALMVATLVRAALTPLWGSGYTFISYYPAIMLSLWVGGWKVGAAATLASAVLSYVFFLPSEQVGPPQAAALGFFLLANGVIMLAVEGLRRARVRAEASAAIDAERAKQQRVIAAAVEEHKSRLAGIVEAAMDAIITVDEDQRLVLFNPAAERMFGYRADEVLGAPLARLIPERFRGAHDGHVRRYSEAGTTSRRMGGLGAVSGLRANGEEFPIEASISQAEVGGRRWLTVILRDITERKRTQEALEDQLNLMKTITDNATSGLFMMDPRGHASFVNPAAEQITGFRREEFSGRPLHDIIHHTHPDGTPFPIEDCPIDRALPLQESVQGYEDVFVHKDGHFYPVRCAARPILKDGLSIGTVIEVQDITKERQAAEDLRLLASDLERRVRERTADLVRSQDRLRTLASQLAMAEQRLRHRLATELHDYLAQLLALGRIKLGHARQLLSAVTTGEQPLKDLEDILARALAYTRTVMAELSPPVLHDLGLAVGLEWLGQQMGRHGLSVTVEHEPAAAALAAEASEDIRVMLFQSARELLMNVVKHSEVAEAKLILSREGAERLLLTVRDEGKGFDPETVDARAGGGDHFGLFSLRERMEAVGGGMELESAPGQGTTVTLSVAVSSLSVTGATSEKRETSQKYRQSISVSPVSPVAPLSPVSPATPIRVLLVDDHVVVRQGLRGVLEGYTDVIVVGEAGNGEEGVTLARELRPDVVLMDINMPRMDGFTATAQIVKERPETLVIGLSVNNSGQTRDAMRAAGAVGFVTKESAADELYEAVVRAVRER